MNSALVTIMMYLSQRRCDKKLPCQHTCEKNRGPNHICACFKMIRNASRICPNKCLRMLTCGHLCQLELTNAPCICYCHQCATMRAEHNYALLCLAEAKPPVIMNNGNFEHGVADAVTSLYEESPRGVAIVQQQHRASVIHYHSSLTNTIVPLGLSKPQNYQQVLPDYFARYNCVQDGPVEVGEYVEVEETEPAALSPQAAYDNCTNGQDENQGMTELGITDEQVVEIALLRVALESVQRNNLELNKELEAERKKVTDKITPNLQAEIKEYLDLIQRNTISESEYSLDHI